MDNEQDRETHSCPVCEWLHQCFQLKEGEEIDVVKKLVRMRSLYTGILNRMAEQVTEMSQELKKGEHRAMIEEVSSAFFPPANKTPLQD